MNSTISRKVRRTDNQAPRRQVHGPQHTTLQPGEVFRADLVKRIQAEIAAGTYDTEEKLLAACENMLARIGS